MFFRFCLEGVWGFGDPKLETAQEKTKSVSRSCTLARPTKSGGLEHSEGCADTRECHLVTMRLLGIIHHRDTPSCPTHFVQNHLVELGFGFGFLLEQVLNDE